MERLEELNNLVENGADFLDVGTHGINIIDDKAGWTYVTYRGVTRNLEDAIAWAQAD